jgi:peroxiredoxin
MFHTVLIFILLLLSAMGGVFLPGCKEDEVSVDVDNTPAGGTQTDPQGDFQKAPAFTLLDVDGKPISLKDFEGKVTLINFWATWCLPCRREMPELVELYNQYKAAGFEMIAISLDDEKTRKDVVPFMTEFGMNFTVLLADGGVQKDYQLFGLPSTFVLDRAHRIRFSHVGAQPKTLFEAEVKTLLVE